MLFAFFILFGGAFEVSPSQLAKAGFADNCNKSFAKLTARENLAPVDRNGLELEENFKNYIFFDRMPNGSLPLSPAEYLARTHELAEAQLKLLGVQYEVVTFELSRGLKISPVRGVSKLNNLAFSLNEKLKKELVFSPSSLKSENAAGFTSKKAIALDYLSLKRGSTSPTLSHEIRHAYLDLINENSRVFMGSFLKARSSGIPKKYLFGAYFGGFRMDELMAHLQGYRQILGQYHRDRIAVKTLSTKLQDLDSELVLALARERRLLVPLDQIGAKNELRWGWPVNSKIDRVALAADLEETKELLEAAKLRKREFLKDSRKDIILRLRGMALVATDETENIANLLEKNLKKFKLIPEEYKDFGTLGFSLGDSLSTRFKLTRYKSGGQWDLKMVDEEDSITGYYFSKLPMPTEISQLLDQKFIKGNWWKKEKPWEVITEADRTQLHNAFLKYLVWLRERQRIYAKIKAGADELLAALNKDDLDLAMERLARVREMVIQEFYQELL